MTQREIKGLIDGLSQEELEQSRRDKSVQTRGQLTTMVEGQTVNSGESSVTAASTSPRLDDTIAATSPTHAGAIPSTHAEQPQKELELQQSQQLEPQQQQQQQQHTEASEPLSREMIRFIEIMARKEAERVALAAASATATAGYMPSSAAFGSDPPGLYPPPGQQLDTEELTALAQQTLGIGQGTRVPPTSQFTNPTFQLEQLAPPVPQAVPSPTLTPQEFHAKQIESVESIIHSVSWGEQPQLREKLYRRQVFPFATSVSDLLSYPTAAYVLWNDLWNEMMDTFIPFSRASLPELQALISQEELGRFTAMLKAAAYKRTSSSNTTRPIPTPHSKVEDWVAQLGRSRPTTIIDGSKPTDAQRFADLQISINNAEPLMTFAFEDCSPPEQLMVWEARLRFIGRHLQGRALHRFSAALDGEEAHRIRDSIRRGYNDYAPDRVYQLTLRAVEKVVCDDTNPMQYHLDKLEKIRQVRDVASYNTAFETQLEYVTGIEPMLVWKMYLSGLKDDLRGDVAKFFVLQTRNCQYPLKDAMAYAKASDEQHQSRTYANNPFGAIRPGGLTERTPYAPNGGRGYMGFGRGGGYMGGRGNIGGGYWDAGQHQGGNFGGPPGGNGGGNFGGPPGGNGGGNFGGPQGSNGGGGQIDGWWRNPGRGHMGPGRGAPPGSGPGHPPVGPGRGSINP